MSYINNINVNNNNIAINYDNNPYYIHRKSNNTIPSNQHKNKNSH